MDDDASLLDWLLTLEQDGLCLIENAPLKESIVIDVCNRVFFPKRNYYGCCFSLLPNLHKNHGPIKFMLVLVFF